MTSPLIHSLGLITLTYGQREITGTGTAWAINGVAGGALAVDVAGATPAFIAEISDDETGLLATNWYGPSGTYEYAISLATAVAANNVYGTRQWTRVVAGGLLAAIHPDASGTLAEREALDPPLATGKWFGRGEVDTTELFLDLKVDDGWRSFSARGAPGSQGPRGFAGDMSFMVAIADPDGIGAMEYPVIDHVTVPGAYDLLIGNVRDGDPESEVDFYVAVNGVPAYGPVTAGVGTVLEIDDAAINLSEGDRVGLVVSAVIGEVREFWALVAPAHTEVDAMQAAVYDPEGIGDDAFDMDNMVEGADTKIMTAGERAKLGGLPDVSGLADALDLKADHATTITAGDGLTGGGDLSANRTLAVDFGTGATQVPTGNHGHADATDSVAGFMSAADKAALDLLVASVQPGRYLLDDGSVSAAASLDIDLTTLIAAGWERFEVEIEELMPVNDNVVLQMLVSEDGGSSWLSTSYRWQKNMFHGGLAATRNGNDSKFELAASIGNAADEGVHLLVVAIRRLSPVLYKAEGLPTNTSNLPEPSMGWGERLATAANAIRLQFSSGNIASGTWRLYGVRDGDLS